MRIKKYLIIIFFILNFIFILKGEYILDPILLLHSRGGRKEATGKICIAGKIQNLFGEII